VAVDGKTLCGSGPTGAQVHLLAVMDHTSRAVLGQVQINGKSNEITALRPLLGPLDLIRRVVTADAMLTQREHVDFLVTVKHAVYVCVVKRNHLRICTSIPRRCRGGRRRSPITPANAGTAATRSATCRS
jgi:hypothetical protein